MLQLQIVDTAYCPETRTTQSDRPSVNRTVVALDVFQQAYRDWQPVVDEPGVIRYPASGRLSSSSRKINDSYGRPVACRRPISQVRFAER